MSKTPSEHPRPQLTRPELTLGKRLVFYAVTVVLFFSLVELLLALGGIRPVVVDEDPYVGFSSRLRLYEDDGRGNLKTAANKLDLFNDQRFSATKPRGTTRVFTLGGSCTYGRPFDDRTSWSGWLRAYLGAVAPDRDWEVLNAGGISYASYRVATLMEELVEYDPDLFVIYSGHNEFLEKRTYAAIIAEPKALTRTKELLQKSRLWAGSRRLVTLRRQRAERSYEMNGEVQELLDSSAGLDYYFRDAAFKKQVLDHYRFNLQRMVNLARGNGAEVILVTIPINEKDFSPFKSQHRDGLPDGKRQRHEALLATAWNVLDRDDFAAALQASDEATDLDTLYAEGHYLRGKALQGLGRFAEAGEAFARAVKEDVCPLRALDETNAVIRETAANNRVALVDYRELLKAEMQRMSGHENLGDELFLDHAHPTVEANGILGRAVVETMAAAGLVDARLVDAPAGQLTAADASVGAEVLGRIDDEARAEAYKNLSKLLIWAGKKQEAEKYVRLAGETLGDDWEVVYNEGVVHFDAGDVTQAIASFERSAKLAPTRGQVHALLGIAYATAGRLDEAVAAGREAVRVEPRQASAWNNLGTSLNARGDHDQAIAAIKEALRLQKGFAEAHNNLAKVYFDLGRLDEALASYERATELRPSYVEAMANRGLVLGAMGRYDESVAAFDAVLVLAPDLEVARRGRAQALAEKRGGGRPAPPTDAASTSSASELIRKGRLLAREERYDEAAEAFTQAIEAASDSAPEAVAARVDLGNLHMAQGRSDEAITIFREAVGKNDGDDRLHHVLATALLISRQFEEGTAHLERAVGLNPQNAMAANDLATIYEHLGREKEALALYRQAAAINPNVPGVTASIARLSSKEAQ